MLVGALDDVECGEDRASGVDDDAGAEPVASSFPSGCSASISTSEGRICWYTTADVAGCDCRSSTAFLTTSEAIVRAPASSSGGVESRCVTATAAASASRRMSAAAAVASLVRLRPRSPPPSGGWSGGVSR